MQSHTTTRPAVTPDPGDTRPRVGPDGRRLVLVVVGLALLPLVVSAIAIVVRGGALHPWGDQALLELDVRDVTRHFVLTGAYSRFGWRHPGPLELYLVALPYRLVAEHSVGIYLGALLLNGVAIAGIAHLARRRAGTPLLVWSMFVTLLLVRTFGPNAVRNPWTPYVTVIPCLLMILLGWSLVEGDTWALPFAVATGSFLVQAHVEYTALVVVLVGGGLVVLAVRALAEPGRPHIARLARITAISAVVGVLLWIPPVVQQLTHHPGNLGLLVRFFRAGHPGHGLSTALHVVAGEWSWRPNWLVHWGSVRAASGELNTSSSPVPVLLVPYVAALALSWRRAPSARNLLLVVAASWAVAIVSVTHIVGGLYPYLLRWLDALGAATLLAIGFALWTRLADARRGVRLAVSAATAVTAVAVAGLVATSVVACVASGRARIPYAAESQMLARLEKPVLTAARDAHGLVVLRRDDTGYAAATLAGIALELERHHVPVRVDARKDPALGALFTTSRLFHTSMANATAVWLTVTAGGRVPPDAGNQIASAGPVRVLQLRFLGR